MDLIINKEKFNAFLEVARALNKNDVVPILFGSLGLNRVIGEFTEANDIDIIVPDKFIGEKWGQLKHIMEELNFKLQDEHEHAFVRNSQIVAFGKSNDLIKLAAINPSTLLITEIDGIKFKELSAEQYLSCYKLMLRDEYRQEKRRGVDKEKISLIQKYLENKK